MPGRALLTSAKALEIFKKKQGPSGQESAKVVGKMYNVSEKAVRDIWCGRTWAHATGLGDGTRRPVGRPKGSRDSRPRSPRCATCTIDEQLLAWTRTSFVRAYLFVNDKIVGLDE
jgi:hypothetical protein